MKDNKIVQDIVDCMPKLRRYAMKFRRDEEPEDLVQATVTRALDNIDQFAPGTNLEAWLMTILKNTFYNTYRRCQYAKQVQNDYSRQNSALIAPDNPETSLILKDLLSNVAKLPPDSQEILFLACNRYSYNEIAKRTGMPAGTVKSRLSRARQKLRGLS